MIQVGIIREELVKALGALDEATKRGFPSSIAILRLSEIGKGISDDRMEFDERLIIKAHPTDGSKNWGNVPTKDLHWYKCEDGKLIEP